MPRISEIHPIRFRLPLAGSLSWGKASRMDSLEHILVRLVTDTGHVGLAEAPPRPTIYGETIESIQAIIRHYIAPRVVGMDIGDIEGINRQMDVIAHNNSAKGAIDICLHEALAASQGKSLLEFLNPPHPKVKVSYILGISDRATMLAEARTVYNQGVRVFKVKVGRDFAGDLSRIRALQAEYEGSDMWLYVDANEAFQPDQAQTQLHQLAARGALYVEEPLPIELIIDRANLRQAEIVPLIADDSAFTYRDLTREIRFNTFDILNIKPARTGYFHSNRMLAAAKKYHKGVMVGSQASSTVGTVRAALFAGSKGIDYPSELSFFLKLEDDIVNRPIEIVDGYIHLDSLATISIDEQRLKRFST